MPLSEHEEQILADIERQLEREDPKLVSRTRPGRRRSTRTTRLRWSVVGFVLGFVALLGITFELLLGAAGFALMLVSLVVGLDTLRDEADDGISISERLRRALQGRDHAH